jgi:predicted dehydrogenase
MSKKEPLIIGIAGYGWWGKVIAALLAGSPNFELRCIAEPATELHPTPRPEALKDVKFYSDFESLIQQPGLEAVVICTPHPQHADQIIAAANRGLHVFCEKPLCMNLPDAMRAINACEDRHLVLGVGHERRFEPAMIRLKKEMTAELYGVPLQIEANFSQDKFLNLPRDNWRLSNQVAPVGPLTATGIHLVDLSVSFLGKPRSVAARLTSRGAGFENGDTLAIFLEFESGAVSLMSAILATPFDGRFAIYGSKGWAEIRDRTHPENPTGWDVTKTLRGEAQEKEFFEPHQAVLANLNAFALAVRGVAPYPIHSAEKLYTVGALEAIMRAVLSNKVEPITL